MATGPKDPEFLWLAARVGATVNLDSPGELERLAGLVRGYGLGRVDVLVRLSGFESAAGHGERAPGCSPAAAASAPRCGTCRHWCRPWNDTRTPSS
ncbi:hypothetical protein SGRIM128S_08885 [Streptomyces griseomycini]